MPTYEYECTACGHCFEKFQSMKDRPVRVCPVCKGKVQRLISTGAGIIFKGSGFYETDYKKKGATSSSVSSSAPSSTQSASTTSADSGTNEAATNAKKTSSSKETSC